MPTKWERYLCWFNLNIYKKNYLQVVGKKTSGRKSCSLSAKDEEKKETDRKRDFRPSRSGLYHPFLWELLSTHSWYIQNSSADCLQFASRPIQTGLLGRSCGLSEWTGQCPQRMTRGIIPQFSWHSHQTYFYPIYHREKNSLKCQYHQEIYKWWGLVTADWIRVCILSNWGRIMPQI